MDIGFWILDFLKGIMDFDVKLKVDVNWIEVSLTWYVLDGVNVELNVKIFSDAWRSCCIFEWRYDVGFEYEARFCIFQLIVFIIRLNRCSSIETQKPNVKGK